MLFICAYLLNYNLYKSTLSSSNLWLNNNKNLLQKTSFGVNIILVQKDTYTKLDIQINKIRSHVHIYWNEQLVEGLQQCLSTNAFIQYSNSFIYIMDPNSCHAVINMETSDSYPFIRMCFDKTTFYFSSRKNSSEAYCFEICYPYFDNFTLYGCFVHTSLYI